MTRRERQLLEWIRENPCISQQELADKAGITRSSAAVHISNLMRKGYIAGRGYLLREAPYIAVVGGVNMDIGAVSDAPLATMGCTYANAFTITGPPLPGSAVLSPLPPPPQPVMANAATEVRARC